VDEQFAVSEFQTSEAHLKVDVSVQADEVLNRGEDALEGVIDHIFTHLARGCNGHRVSIDGFETLLVDTLLTAGIVDNLLLAVVTV